MAAMWIGCGLLRMGFATQLLMLWVRGARDGRCASNPRHMSCAAAFPQHAMRGTMCLRVPSLLREAIESSSPLCVSGAAAACDATADAITDRLRRKNHNQPSIPASIDATKSKCNCSAMHVHDIEQTRDSRKTRNIPLCSLSRVGDTDSRR